MNESTRYADDKHSLTAELGCKQADPKIHMYSLMPIVFFLVETAEPQSSFPHNMSVFFRFHCVTSCTFLHSPCVFISKSPAQRLDPPTNLTALGSERLEVIVRNRWRHIFRPRLCMLATHGVWLKLFRWVKRFNHYFVWLPMKINMPTAGLWFYRIQRQSKPFGFWCLTSKLVTFPIMHLLFVFLSAVITTGNHGNICGDAPVNTATHQTHTRAAVMSESYSSFITAGLIKNAHASQGSIKIKTHIKVTAPLPEQVSPTALPEEQVLLAELSPSP